MGALIRVYSGIRENRGIVVFRVNVVFVLGFVWRVEGI